MGFFSPSYNYKSAYGIVPGGQQYLDALNNYDPSNYVNTGLGAAGKYARGIINKMQGGQDVSSYMAPELASLNYASARNKDLEDSRMAAMGNLTGQPMVAQAQMQSADRNRDQDLGANIAGANANLRNQALGTFNQARAMQNSQRDLEAEQELQKRQYANQDWLNSIKGATGPSMFSQIMGGAASLGGAALGGPFGEALGSELFHSM